MPGQKGIFWIVIIGGALMSRVRLVPAVSRIIPANVTALQFWTVIHAVIAMLFIAAMLAHIYIGSVGMEGAFDAMGTGEVDLNWAKGTTRSGSRNSRPRAGARYRKSAGPCPPNNSTYSIRLHTYIKGLNRQAGRSL